jgi:hypothetical protein
MANETSTLEDKETVRAETLQLLAVFSQLNAVVDDVAKTQFHELADNIPLLTHRLQRIAAASPDNTILNQTMASSTLQFAYNVLAQIDTLKTFGTSKSTWQLLPNDSNHKAYTTGGRAKFLRHLCTVETALMIMKHADTEQLRLTGNFVVEVPCVIKRFSTSPTVEAGLRVTDSMQVAKLFRDLGVPQTCAARPDARVRDARDIAALESIG